MTEHFELDSLELERISAIAVRLINLGWFRVGSEEYACKYRTFGISTLRKKHVRVAGRRITFSYPGKRGAWVRAALGDTDLAASMRELKRLRGGNRLFRYGLNGQLANVTARHLNDYIAEFMGEEFSAKDFRTWGGTQLAAVALAERGPAETETEAKRTLAGVMRMVGEKLGNTAAVARESYVSPAVVEQYLAGRTLEDFRPRHLRVLGARDVGLDAEEQALLSLLRSWRLLEARQEGDKAA
jgi:DNA topoisomerase I